MPQSYLIISPNLTIREVEVDRLLAEVSVDRFDRTVVERGEVDAKGEELKRKASLGIEDVKTMQKTLYFKPLRGETKAVIIKDAHLLTVEAQNALLKVLEEPPEHTLLILTAETKEALLPTILSRCSLIELREEKPDISKEERAAFTAILTTLPEWGTGKALKQAEQLAKNKDEALLWLEKMIVTTRSALIEEISRTTHTPQTSRTGSYLSLLRHLQQTHKTIKTTNANLRLTLENFFLQ